MMTYTRSGQVVILRAAGLRTGRLFASLNTLREPAVPDGDVGNGLPIAAGVEVEFYQL